MTRRALSEDMTRTYGSKLLNVNQIMQFTGRSRSTVERGICKHCTVFRAGRTKLYHVTDIAAVLDSGE